VRIRHGTTSERVRERERERERVRDLSFELVKALQFDGDASAACPG